MVLYRLTVFLSSVPSFVKDDVILNGTEDVKKMAEKMEERRKQAKLSKVSAEIITITTCNHRIIEKEESCLTTSGTRINQ